MIDSDIRHLPPEFRVKVESIVADLTAWCRKHYPNHSAMLFEGFRSVQRQKDLYRQGRRGNVIVDRKKVVTYCDGVKSPSRHQSGLAADIIVRNPDGRPSWEAPAEFWAYLGHLARAAGLEYGGDFKTIKDLDHIQVKESNHFAYLRARTWLRDNKLI